MIYWFTGQPSMVIWVQNYIDFYKLKKRNWRKSVFHIDGDDRKLTSNKDYSDSGRENNIRTAQTMAQYIHNNDCDVVVSLVQRALES